MPNLLSTESSLTLTESVVKITTTEEVTLVNITPVVTTIEAKGLAISIASASQMPFVPHGTVTATNVQTALEQLADQDFRSNDTPTGTNVSEGDTWYDLDDNTMKVYREISSGVFAWTNVVVAETNDTLDAGAF